MIRLLSVALVVLLVPTAAAQAQCGRLSLRLLGAHSWSSSASGDYSPFDSTQYFQQEDVQARKSGGGQCDFFITLSTGDSGGFGQRQMTGGADVLTYNFYDAPNVSANVLKDFPDALTLSDVLDGQMTDTKKIETNTLLYYWSIDPQLVVGAATYQDSAVIFSLYQGTIAAPTLEDQLTVTVSAVVPQVVELSLVPTGGAFDAADINETVNFGTLVEGAQQSFDLLVRSNSGYQVSFQSAESSTMRKSPPNPDNVSYTVTVGGNPADLSSGAGVVVATAGGATPVNGDRLAVTFTVGTVSGRRTGSYDDNITVTVSAL